MRMGHLIGAAGLVATLPFTMGAKGCAINSTDAAPNVTGNWAVSYAPELDVKVTIGGSAYTQKLGANGGSFTINHAGTALDFSLDCSKPEVICPSEVWPTEVAINQKDPTYQHRMWVDIPTQSCSGALVAPDPSECGAGTQNPDCSPVCSGVVSTTTAEAFGVIANDGGSFNLLLGGGVATNGFDCALLGISFAKANLVSTGSAETPSSWTAQSMTDGEIDAAYAGGCLWAGTTMDNTTKALLVGATVELTTPFSAARN